MSDFDLDKSRWYNAMKIALSAESIHGEAKVIAARAPLLARYPYDAVAGKTLADIEEKVSEALGVVQAAREEYEQKRIALVAAE